MSAEGECKRNLGVGVTGVIVVLAGVLLLWDAAAYRLVTLRHEDGSPLIRDDGTLVSACPTLLERYILRKYDPDVRTWEIWTGPILVVIGLFACVRSFRRIIALLEAAITNGTRIPWIHAVEDGFDKLASWFQFEYEHVRRNRLAGRVALPMNEWYAQYYRDSGIPKEVVLGMLINVASEIRIEPGKLRPSDSLDGILKAEGDVYDDGVGLLFAVVQASLAKAGIDAHLNSIDDLIRANWRLTVRRSEPTQRGGSLADSCEPPCCRLLPVVDDNTGLFLPG